MRSFFHARSISPTFPSAAVRRSIALSALAALVATTVTACGGDDDPGADRSLLITQGQQIFRFDTFGDEAKWTDTLRMHEVIRTSADAQTAVGCGIKCASLARQRALTR